MKAQAIEKLLIGLCNNFFASIKDEKLREKVKNSCFITGGCIPSMMMDEFVTDFDFYFVNLEVTIKLREYYRSQLLIGGCHIEQNGLFTKITYQSPSGEMPKNSFKPVFISPQAITLTDKIQLVTKFYGTPIDVIREFDWAHIKSYFIYPKLYINDITYKLINEKELIYTGSKYPLSSFMRTRKYIKKGWTISAIESLKIALDMARYDLTNMEVLSDQMMGIDPTYMMSILKDLKEKQYSIDELLNEIERLENLND